MAKAQTLILGNIDLLLFMGKSQEKFGELDCGLRRNGLLYETPQFLGIFNKILDGQIPSNLTASPAYRIRLVKP